MSSLPDCSPTLTTPTTQEKPEDVKDLHSSFVQLVYSPTPKEVFTAFIEKWSDIQPQYVAYVQAQWGKTMDKWAIGLCAVPLQGIHNNNFIESWHRNFKYHFLNRLVRLRPNEFLHTLVFDVVPDFRQTVLATQLGFKGQARTKFQGITKGEADSYTDKDLKDLGIKIWSVTPTHVSTLTLPLAHIRQP